MTWHMWHVTSGLALTCLGLLRAFVLTPPVPSPSRALALMCLASALACVANTPHCQTRKTHAHPVHVFLLRRGKEVSHRVAAVAAAYLRRCHGMSRAGYLSGPHAIVATACRSLCRRHRLPQPMS